MDGWNLPQFDWPWPEYWRQFQDWATDREVTPIDPWGLARQAGYYGARAGQNFLDWSSPAWQPMNEWLYSPERSWYDSPWTQPW